ncbi:MAG: PDZ domain-containing protein [Bdellovibrionales bacterium]|nr:PDZ domain-containing protein [Bdellovibrionales bacterium]
MGQDQWGRYYIGDVITKINNTEVNTYDDIYQVLDKTKIGDQVVVEYIRNNRSLSTKVNLMELK